MNYSNIEQICKEYCIENYTINQDGTVDVDGDVDLFDKNLTRLPLKFGKVSGYFSCSWNKLTTLEGVPKTVRSFNCGNNQLTTLECCPTEVGGAFSCSQNQLTTLEGCPKTVSGNFWCNNNLLTTLEGGPKEVGGGFYCKNNPLPEEIIDNPKAFLKQLNRDKIINELLEY